MIEVVSVLSFVLATLAAFKLIDVGISLLRPYLSAESILPIASFVIIFFGVIIGVTFLGKLVKKFLDITLLGNIDDVAGAVVGFLKWGFGLSILMWLLNKAQIVIPDEVVSESLLFPYLVKYGPFMIDLFASILPFGKGVVTSINELLAPLHGPSY